MGKKRRQPNPYAADEGSEQANGVNCENAPELPATPKNTCQHLARSIDPPRIHKNLKSDDSGKLICTICQKKKEMIPSSDEKWICLQCGQCQCTKDHSSQHHSIPRSESHCLAFCYTDSKVWCHECEMVIPEDGSKKLKACLSQIKNVMEQLQRAPSIGPSSSDEMPPPLLEMDEKGGGGGSALPIPPTLPAPPTNCLNNIDKNKNIARKGILKNPQPPVRGLMNLGNTCFYNSVLQCLARTPNLIDTLKLMESDDQQIFVQLDNGDNLEGTLEKCRDGLSSTLGDLLESLRKAGSAVNPKSLLQLLRQKCPQFEGYNQHDAHELLRHLLDNVRLADHKRYKMLILKKMGLAVKVKPADVPQEQQKKLRALDHEVVDKVTLVPEQVFKGKLISTLECQECKSQSHRIESFLDLSLPIVLDKDKRQPSAAFLRKHTSSPEPEETDDSSNRRRRRPVKLTNHRRDRRTNRADQPSSVIVNNTSDHGESDADVEDNDDGERNRLESGYSSEKAEDEEQETRASGASDDSARASPASTAAVEKLEEKNYRDQKPVCAGAVPVPSCNEFIGELRKRLGPCPEERERWEWRRDERQNCTKELLLNRPGQVAAVHAIRDPSKIPNDDPAYLILPRSGRPPTAPPGPSGDSGDVDLNRISNQMSPVLAASIAKVVEGILPSAQEVNERLGSLSLNSPNSTSGDISMNNASNELPDSTDGQIVESSSLAVNSTCNDAESSCQPDSSTTMPIVELNCDASPVADSSTLDNYSELRRLVSEKNKSTCDSPPDCTSSPQVRIEEVDCDLSPIGSSAMSPMNNTERDDRDSERIRMRGPPVDDGQDGSCSIQACLSKFLSKELLTNANRVGCSTCTKNRGNPESKAVCTDTSKQFLIKEAPQVLILHLKRFQMRMYSFRKLSKLVTFPLVLDLAPFCEPELQKNEEGNLMYSLYGVVEHSGTLNGGHYVAYVKVSNEDDFSEESGSTRWFCISDSHVTAVTEDRVLNSEAYLLFYKRFSET